MRGILILCCCCRPVDDSTNNLSDCFSILFTPTYLFLWLLLLLHCILFFFKLFNNMSSVYCRSKWCWVWKYLWKQCLRLFNLYTNITFNIFLSILLCKQKKKRRHVEHCFNKIIDLLFYKYKYQHRDNAGYSVQW